MLRFFTTFFNNILIRMMLHLLRSKKQVIHNLLSIQVKTTSGGTLSIDIDPKWDVSHIKRILSPKIGLPPDELKVIFAGKELSDDIIIGECDLGQQSILHIVKIRPRNQTQGDFSENIVTTSTPIIKKPTLLPLCEILNDTMFSTGSTNNSVYSSVCNETLINDIETVDPETEILGSKRVHFYVYCPTCKGLKQGKLRVRCHFCKSGAFTVHTDPQNWTHVLEHKQITGTCENNADLCEKLLSNKEPTFAEFYFKCSEHISLGENDRALPLDLIRPNLRQIQCLACLETPEIVFSFPCQNNHITCLVCFKQYCISKLTDRQFWQHPEYGYTLSCPIGCLDSFIKEIHHFRLLDDYNYDRYHRFATEEFVLQAGGILCPQPGCGMGILADPDCTRITCQHCKYVFCRNCLHYHVGQCSPTETLDGASGSCDIELTCDNINSGEEASKTTIKVITKPCPNCKTPTERDGGCMHMICTRSGCKFHWCWVCQAKWTRECMGDHWFG